MTRRINSVGAMLLLAATTASAQVPFSSEQIPTPTALARIGLKRHWYGVVPMTGAERVAQVSVDKDLVFVHTDQGNFHTLEAESGRYLWSAKIGTPTPKALDASANSVAVFVANSNTITALARSTGQVIWKRTMPASAASPPSADEQRVFVGLLDGRLDVRDTADGDEIWQVQTRGPLVSKPIPAGKVVAFASADGKVFVSLSDKLRPLIRWSAVGGIKAPLTHSGARTVIVSSLDKSIYAMDLFTGATKWNFPTGAPIELEPLVTSSDVYVVNNEGNFSSLDLATGEARWTISTLGGPLLAVSNKRIYLETRDGDLFVVDRSNGGMVFGPSATHTRAGVNIRPFEFGPTNRGNDRVYLGSKSGLIVCLRELDQVGPRPLVDPSTKPLGYIPPEGYDDDVKLPPAPTPGENGEQPADAAKPEAEAPKPEPEGNNGDTPK